MRRGLRYLPVVLILLLVVVAALGANARGPRVTHVAPLPIRPTVSTSGSPPAQPSRSVVRPPQPHDSGPGTTVLIVVIAALCALAYGAIMLYLMLALRDGLVLRRRRHPEPDPEPEEPDAPTADEVRAAMAASRAALIEGDDPRAAVIACWLTLEELASRGGVPRSASDVPGDLVGRMLGVARDPSGAPRFRALTGPAERALTDLAERYRAARYAPAPVTEADRAAARTALDRLAAELSVRDAAPTGGAQ
ncbi:hypothetical protein Athai_05140 [Actinocatenispora thailandica]|uniref:Protein-glutamine gamma-glutamyltransferase-like C-terminal domain-containing protein n=1 Tax=Actinocatenispora thailandica TaxID=227318 RepID=A0A7R7DK27_9ACTN|nr:DUF4129 domain-containing protein [Actinocatenispora thailandica]BCJ33011.1 hypothetical protein Athai_05140 [Actinocatenispora thailandica]